MSQRVLHYNAIFPRRSLYARLLSVLAALSVAAAGSSAVWPAQSDQTPVFRSGVEVMEVDVTVVDAKGDAGARSARAGIHGHRRRAAAARRQRGIHLRRSTPSARAREAPRSLCVEQHRSPPGPPDHARRSIATTSTRTRCAAPLGALKQFVDEHRAGRPAGARHDPAARTDRSISPPTTRRCSTPSRASSGRTDSMLSRFNISDYEARHVRKSIEPTRHAAAAVSHMRRHRPEHDVAVRSRRRAGGADHRARISGS